jgi:hypothetical protein
MGLPKLGPDPAIAAAGFVVGSSRRDGLRAALRSEATGPALEQALALALVIFMALAEFIYTRLLRPAPVRRAANAILLSIVPETVRVGRVILRLAWRTRFNPASMIYAAPLPGRNVAEQTQADRAVTPPPCARQ